MTPEQYIEEKVQFLKNIIFTEYDSENIEHVDMGAKDFINWFETTLKQAMKQGVMMSAPEKKIGSEHNHNEIDAIIWNDYLQQTLLNAENNFK